MDEWPETESLADDLEQFFIYLAVLGNVTPESSVRPPRMRLVSSEDGGWIAAPLAVPASVMGRFVSRVRELEGEKKPVRKPGWGQG